MNATDETATTTATATSGPTPKRSGEDLTALLEVAHRATVAYGRPDLTHVIDRAAARHAERDLSVLVVGEFKQGKSTLVNALVDARRCIGRRRRRHRGADDRELWRRGERPRRVPSTAR